MIYGVGYACACHSVNTEVRGYLRGSVFFFYLVGPRASSLTARLLIHWVISPSQAQNS